MADPNCPFCRQPLIVERFLKSAVYWLSQGMGEGECPCCHTRTEFKMEDGKLELGYTYAAGTVHFCGMEQISAPGLRWVRVGDSVGVELDGVPLQIPLYGPR